MVLNTISSIKYEILRMCLYRGLPHLSFDLNYAIFALVQLSMFWVCLIQYSSPVL